MKTVARVVMMLVAGMLIGGSARADEFLDNWNTSKQTYDDAQAIKTSNNSDVNQWWQESMVVMPFGADQDFVQTQCGLAMEDYDAAQEDLDLCGYDLHLSMEAYIIYLATDNQYFLQSANTFLTSANVNGINALLHISDGNAHRTAAWEVYEPYAP